MAEEQARFDGFGLVDAMIECSTSTARMKEFQKHIVILGRIDKLAKEDDNKTPEYTRALIDVRSLIVEEITR